MDQAKLNLEALRFKVNKHLWTPGTPIQVYFRMFRFFFHYYFKSGTYLSSDIS